MIHSGLEPSDSTTVVGIGEIACRRGGELITHALGSCVGITMHDPASGEGGMLHVQLPSSKAARSEAEAAADVGRYADTAMARLIELLRLRGIPQRCLTIVLAGGATMPNSSTFFDIAMRNLVAVRKWLWSQHLLVAAEDTGGADPRTMRLELESGRVSVSTAGRSKILYQGRR